MAQWVSVKERLPEEGELVIGANIEGKYISDNGYVGAFEYCSGIFCYEGVGREITHWMPLPEPPVETRE